MEIALPKDAKDNPHTLLRRLGYGLERNRRTGEESYARRLAGTPFPRFHVYVNDAPSPLTLSQRGEGEVVSHHGLSPSEGRGNITINLHLDQKAPSYEGSHAHSGEYDGALVEQEAERITDFLAHST